MEFNSCFKGLMKGSKIPRIELNTVHLCQHYSLFMPNKLLYTWHGDYCECVRPAQLPVLTEVRAPSLLEQYPRYVPHRDRAGYNTGLKAQLRLLDRADLLEEYNTPWTTVNVLMASNASHRSKSNCHSLNCIKLYFFCGHYLKGKQLNSFNLLKRNGYVMHQQFNIQQLYALSTLY